MGQPDKSPVGRSKSTDSVQDKFSVPKGDNEEDMQVDLMNLVPDNFSEIPYVSQINVKRKAMESFNTEL